LKKGSGRDWKGIESCIVDSDEDAGAPYSAVSTLLGHKRKDQTATYTHAQMPAMKKTVEVLEEWCKQIDGFTAVASILIESSLERIA
jgi:hypothetical protein